MSDIRLYIEGGGDQKNTMAAFRKAISLLFGRLIGTYAQRLRVVACGGRDEAIDYCINAVAEHAEDFCFLLIDSDMPVMGTTLQHYQRLKRGKEILCVAGVASEYLLHLMVQCMEAWVVADPKGLARACGEAGFHAKALPVSVDPESIMKDDFETIMKSATKDTELGEYEKIDHLWIIFQSVDVEVVGRRCGHLDALCSVLELPSATLRQIVATRR